PPAITQAIRKVHDYVTCGAAHPLQAAGAVALHMGDAYYAELLRQYRERRDFIVPALQRAGFRCQAPDGAYYVMSDASMLLEHLGLEDDVALTRFLVREIGLAAVPGSSFYHDPTTLGKTEVRFVFCKKMETLQRLAPLLEKL